MRRILKILFCVCMVALSAFPQDRIVFDRRFADNYDIFIMNADGTHQRNLTNTPNKEIEPRISPDGRKIVFSSDRNPPGFELYVMELSGSRRTIQITSDTYIDHAPSWSPDGTKIAFGRCNPDGTLCDIYVVNADGTGTPTPIVSSPQDDDLPRFSPNGAQILFVSNRTGNYDIYRCSANGLNQVQLTTHLANESWPDWSPTGSHIIFSSLQNSNTYELWTMQANGSAHQRFTFDNEHHDLEASYSSDGARLVWARSNQTGYQIVEGPSVPAVAPTQLTFTGLRNLNPDYGFVTRKAGRAR